MTIKPMQRNCPHEQFYYFCPVSFSTVEFALFHTSYKHVEKPHCEFLRVTVNWSFWESCWKRSASANIAGFFEAPGVHTGGENHTANVSTFHVNRQVKNYTALVKRMWNAVRSLALCSAKRHRVAWIEWNSFRNCSAFRERRNRNAAELSALISVHMTGCLYLTSSGRRDVE